MAWMHPMNVLVNEFDNSMKIGDIDHMDEIWLQVEETAPPISLAMDGVVGQANRSVFGPNKFLNVYAKYHTSTRESVNNWYTPLHTLACLQPHHLTTSPVRGNNSTFDVPDLAAADDDDGGGGGGDHRDEGDQKVALHRVMDWLFSKEPLMIACKTRLMHFTPLHIAAASASIDVMKWLLEKNPLLIKETDGRGATALHRACEGGIIRSVEWLYDRDPSLLHIGDNTGEIALHYAARWGRRDATKWLLAKDSTMMNTASKIGLTPLHKARQAVNPDVEIFLEECLFFPLHHASSCGDLAAMEAYLQSDSSRISQEDSHRNSPLHLAAAFGQINALHILLNHDPSLITRVNGEGCTAYDMACMHRQNDAVDVLQQAMIRFLKNILRNK